MRLHGKVSLITGAATGIGEVSALLFAEEGAKIVVADVKASEDLETVNKIKKFGGQAVFVEADVSRSEDVRRMIEETVKNFGKLDILFNNAGISIHKSIQETTEEDWDRVHDTNLKGVFLGCKYAVPQMLKQGEGTILNTASEVGLVGANNLVAYCASKGGVIQFTRALSLDLADKNIRVNSLCPGVTMTPLLKNSIVTAPDPDAKKHFLESTVPINRIAAPEEIAKGALFLASSESSFMTGAALVIDGGWTAQ
jgi:NAD(P)-dependent dehydrogenase (short-subunit alcohol dehydrogenase family)